MVFLFLQVPDGEKYTILLIQLCATTWIHVKTPSNLVTSVWTNHFEALGKMKKVCVFVNFIYF